MSVFKIQLRDGTEYQLTDGDIGSKFSIICADREAYINVWQSMTSENLLEVTVTIDDSVLTVMRYLILDTTQAIISPTGTIMGMFYFHGAVYDTPIEPIDADYIEAAKILLGEEA